MLVAVLVGVPVAGATLADGLYRTFGAPERDAYEAIADGDALVEVTPFESLGENYYPSPWGDSWSDDWEERDTAKVDLSTLLPAGTDLVPAPINYNGVRVEHGQGTIRVQAMSTQLDEPLTANRVRLDSGEWPAESAEVLISRGLAERLDLLDGGELTQGASVTLPDGPTLTVAGLGLDPFDTRVESIFAAADSDAIEHIADSGAVDAWSRGEMYGGTGYVAELPTGTDLDDLWPDLAAHGVAVVPRAAFLDPQHYAPEEFAYSSPVSVEELAAAGLVALIVGFGLLEVILLAGAAFAVSARRQIRDLGLVASNGGTARQVRRIVLAQGVVLGILGAVLGLGVGVALTLGGKPLWELASGTLIEGWRFGPAELAIAAAVGMVSGLAAAVIPARGAARLKPVDALAQRFRATPLEARLPRVGLVLLAVGSLGALAASRLAAGELADYSRRIAEAAGTGVWVDEPSNLIVYIAVQLLGAVLAVAGLIMIISPLIAIVAGRLRRWPLSARYAARDAARHRHRTAPAVAAIMIVVASAVGVSIGLSGAERVSELRYTPSLPENVMQLTPADAFAPGGSGVGMADHAEAAEAVEAFAAMLPDGAVVPAEIPVIPTPDGSDDAATGIALDGTEEAEPGFQTLELLPTEAWFEECDQTDCDSPGFWGVHIGSPELYGLLLGEVADDATRRALDDGAIVVLSPAFVDDNGMVSVTTWDDNGEQIEEASLPAHEVTYTGPYHSALPAGFISAETAAEYGWDVQSAQGTYVSFASSATDDEIEAAMDAADESGLYAYVERGCGHCGVPIGLYLALVGGVGLVTVVGVGVVVALAAAEGRADLATMAAVGAPPRRRRSIAGWQALVVGGLGTALGLALGTYYAYLIWPAIGAPEFTVPWHVIGVITIAVPVLAVVIAMTFTRSKLPMMRRLE